MKKKTLILLAICTLTILSLTGCIPGDGSNHSDNLAGFFWGVWHGWLAPISLIVGFFDRDIRVYEVMNSGWLYDLGFYIAVISGFGGLSLSRKSKKD